MSSLTNPSTTLSLYLGIYRDYTVKYSHYITKKLGGKLMTY